MGGLIGRLKRGLKYSNIRLVGLYKDKLVAEPRLTRKGHLNGERHCDYKVMKLLWRAFEPEGKVEIE